MTFPVVVGFSHGTVGPESPVVAPFDHAIPVPAGSLGDLLLIIVVQGSNKQAWTWASGWTLLSTNGIESGHPSPASGTADGVIESRYRVADGSEGTSIDITTPTNQGIAYHSYRFSAYASVPTVSIGGAVNAAPNPPSLTSGFGAVDTMWIAAAGWANDTRTISAYPASYTDGAQDEVSAVGAGGCLATARREIAAATEDPGTFTLTASAWNTTLTIAIKGGSSVPSSGSFAEWDGISFTDESDRIREWTITRGASPELTGGTSPGSATITLINTPDDRFNPEYAAGPLYGYLHDGPRVWIGINADGTIAFDAGKTVYGLFAGRITDLSVIPGEGSTVAPFVELVCEDDLGWMSRQNVTLADSTTRSQYDLRTEVLDALGVVNRSLEVEPTTVPLSSANGLALNILDDINRANGTRHYARPADQASVWYTYTTIRRTSLLNGTSDASLSAASQHVTGTSGWRISADGVINRQRASVEPISFPARVKVWDVALVPFTVVTATPQVIWADLGDYVADLEADYASTGSALTVTVEPFGRTAKLTLTSAGTTAVSRFDLYGYLVERGSTVSAVVDDTTSQAEPRGVRSGPDLSGDYLGTLTSAKGFADHIVWRFGNPLYRPTLTVENWFPTMFDLDIGSRIAFTSTQLGVSARIFEIVGLTHHGIAAGATAIHHTVTYTLQESRVQAAFSWFTWNTSNWNGAAVLGY